MPIALYNLHDLLLGVLICAEKRPSPTPMRRSGPDRDTLVSAAWMPLEQKEETP